MATNNNFTSCSYPSADSLYKVLVTVLVLEVFVLILVLVLGGPLVLVLVGYLPCAVLVYVC